MSTANVQFHHDPANGGFFTTSLFWDCECEEDYIHPLWDEDCPACGSARHEAPDSRINEVIRHSSKLPEKLVETACIQAERDTTFIPF